MVSNKQVKNSNLSLVLEVTVPPMRHGREKGSGTQRTAGTALLPQEAQVIGPPKKQSQMHRVEGGKSMETIENT